MYLVCVCVWGGGVAKSLPRRNHRSKLVIPKLCACSKLLPVSYSADSGLLDLKCDLPLECLKASPGNSNVQTSLATFHLSSDSRPINFSFSSQLSGSCQAQYSQLPMAVLGKEGRFPGFTHYIKKPTPSSFEFTSKEEQKEIRQG